jgi:hypothetical protein
LQCDVVEPDSLAGLAGVVFANLEAVPGLDHDEQGTLEENDGRLPLADDLALRMPYGNCCNQNQPGQEYAKGDADQHVKPQTTGHGWSFGGYLS